MPGFELEPRESGSRIYPIKSKSGISNFSLYFPEHSQVHRKVGTLGGGQVHVQCPQFQLDSLRCGLSFQAILNAPTARGTLMSS
jgi:hypothetical protein